MTVSARRRRQLGVALAVIGLAITFYRGFMEQLALDTTGVRPDSWAGSVAAAILAGLGLTLFVTARQ